MAVSHRLSENEVLDMALTLLDRNDEFPDTVADCLLEELWPEPLAIHGVLNSPASATERDIHTKRDIHTCPRKPREVSLKSKRYRNRKREELQLLRDTVQTLEVRLTALQSLPTQAIAPTIDPSRRVWEAVAHVESERRQEAEHKNNDLREMVMLHYQLAQKLQEVLRKVGEQCGFNFIESF